MTILVKNQISIYSEITWHVNFHRQKKKEKKNTNPHLNSESLSELKNVKSLG